MKNNPKVKMVKLGLSKDDGSSLVTMPLRELEELIENILLGKILIKDDVGDYVDTDDFLKTLEE